MELIWRSSRSKILLSAPYCKKLSLAHYKFTDSMIMLASYVVNLLVVSVLNQYNLNRMERYTNKIRPTVHFVQLERKDIRLPVVSGYEGRLVHLSV